jgi:AcrR family transcriptional regulator
MKTQPPRGRRPGQSDSRERILQAARAAFLAEGYQAVTLRSIATTVGVDVALISYFFGSKQGLFSAAMAFTVSPADVLGEALQGDLRGLPERMLRGLLATWDDPSSGGPLQAIARAAAAEPALRRLLAEAVGVQLIQPIADRLGGDNALDRAALLTSQVAGLIYTRYLLRLEPIASMPPEDVIRGLLPGLRATLRG